jgi:hypothetical protein
MPQETLPDVQSAYNTLFNNVHARVFFHKMASRGYQPQTEKQAGWMLELAGKLRHVNQVHAEKQAQAGQDPFFLANQALDHELAKMGFEVPPAYAADEDLAMKSAAAELSADPVLYNSVLSLKANELATSAAA